MAFAERKKLIQQIETMRKGRRLVSICNFDRAESHANLGMNVPFQSDMKEPLFRVLKELRAGANGIDVYLYTRGGETNAVWPIVCLLREFDPNFQVLAPFRAHSSGTMLAIAANRIVMTRLAELSPIDPTTGNQFNPLDPNDPDKKARLGISVEDVTAFDIFSRKSLGLKDKGPLKPEEAALLQSQVQELTKQVHPLALGNVQRVYTQIKLLAKMLLKKNHGTNDDIDAMIDKLTTSYYSHQHMISRAEASDILGRDHVEFATPKLEQAMDKLLRQYDEDFALRTPFLLPGFMGTDTEKEARFIGGCIEASAWGYLYESKIRITQVSALPPNVNLQLAPGQKMPLVPGMPTAFNFMLTSRKWVRNKQRIGVSK